jgi:hypothetical protein
VINDIFDVVCGSTVRDDPSRIPCHDGIVRNVEVDVRAGSDHHVIADLNASNYDRVRSDPHAVADHRDTLPSPTIALTNHYSRRDVHVTTNPAHGVDCQMPEVTNVESGADFSFYLNIKAIAVSVMLEQNSIQKGACNSQPTRAELRSLALPQEVTEPETRDIAKCSPERKPVVAAAVAPKVSTNRHSEIHRQNISPGRVFKGIVSRAGSPLERQNEIAGNISCTRVG